MAKNAVFIMFFYQKSSQNPQETPFMALVTPKTRVFGIGSTKNSQTDRIIRYLYYESREF